MADREGWHYKTKCAHCDHIETYFVEKTEHVQYPQFRAAVEHRPKYEHCGNCHYMTVNPIVAFDWEEQ